MISNQSSVISIIFYEDESGSAGVSPAVNAQPHPPMPLCVSRALGAKIIATMLRRRFKINVVGFERKLSRIFRKLKKIIFHDNLRLINDNSRSNKKKLFNVVKVVVNMSKISCH